MSDCHLAFAVRFWSLSRVLVALQRPSGSITQQGPLGEHCPQTLLWSSAMRPGVLVRCVLVPSGRMSHVRSDRPSRLVAEAARTIEKPVNLLLGC